MATGDIDEFQAQRQRLFGIAYRMLGSATDADDIVQDAWLRWQSADRSGVQDAAAYLARTVTNLCLTALDSARARREVYVGPWLPEPVLTGAVVPTTAGAAPSGTSSTSTSVTRPVSAGDALDRVELTESVSFALLTLLERLTPAERAAYVLREAFAYSHREVAEVLSITEANARQLATRARARVGAERRRAATTAEWRRLVTRFLDAARDGDLAALETMLADDVTSWSDGGGVVGAALRPVQGRDRVARLIAGIFAKFTEGLTGALGEANGEPVVLAFEGDRLRSVWFVALSSSVDGGIGGDENGGDHSDNTAVGDRPGLSITELRMTLSPEKLAYAQRQLSRNESLSGLS